MRLGADVPRAIHARLRDGLTLPVGPFRLHVRVVRGSAAEPPAGNNSAVVLRQVERLLQLFPELRPFYDESVRSDPPALAALLAFFNDYLPLISEQARETQLRNLLVRVRESIGDPAYREALTLEIAKSDLRSGLPDRATSLLAVDDGTDDIRALKSWLRQQMDEFERHYGARAGFLANVSTWQEMEGDMRGRSLAAVLESRQEELRGRSILHVAPERELKAWLLARRDELRLDYVTLDAFGDDVDLKEDLTALPLADESFDYVICHRVLEHVLDDRAALGEAYRILRPGGILNVSVPMSVHLEATNEWVVPDHSHHGHVRHYGRDFEQRLAEAGFDVALERTLLDRSLEEHVDARTYPMRIYICRKPER